MNNDLKTLLALGSSWIVFDFLESTAPLPFAVSSFRFVAVDFAPSSILTIFDELVLVEATDFSFFGAVDFCKPEVDGLLSSASSTLLAGSKKEMKIKSC